MSLRGRLWLCVQTMPFHLDSRVGLQLHVDSFLVFDAKEDAHGVLIFHKAQGRTSDTVP